MHPVISDQQKDVHLESVTDSPEAGTDMDICMQKIY